MMCLRRRLRSFSLLAGGHFSFSHHSQTSPRVSVLRVLGRHGPQDDPCRLLPPEIRPRVSFLNDPGDYLRPIVFDPNAKAWRDDGRLDD